MSGHYRTTVRELSKDFAAARDTAKSLGEHRGEGPGFVGRLHSGLERMIETQMTAYPSGWSDADRRELAELHLFGRGL